ncbi:hypothetical protein [Halolamina sp. CBA1230]|uniref:hypothetical protein n=1 Tax=Halolamina sp. CBA1230 TaxID=1853690 RepID=UPI002695E768
MTRDKDETTRRTDEPNRPTTARTMGDVSHTNPMTGETFGDSQVFQRGTVAIVDGGEAKAADDRDDSDEEAMKDVDHTPREDAPEANEAYVRGVDREDEVDEEAETAANEGAEDEEPV